MVFKIANGPVAGASFIQTLRPTTTIARYVMSDNGHVSDFVIDSAGAVPRTVSNMTVPGIARVLWVESNGAAILQYVQAEAKRCRRLLPQQIIWLLQATMEGQNHVAK